jgi:hypothetical protein
MPGASAALQRRSFWRWAAAPRSRPVRPRPNHRRRHIGAERCGRRHRLHRLFQSDERIAQKLKFDYVVVLIDVDGDHQGR